MFKSVIAIDWIQIIIKYIIKILSVVWTLQLESTDLKIEDIDGLYRTMYYDTSRNRSDFKNKKNEDACDWFLASILYNE